jgi:hypothetical protein
LLSGYWGVRIGKLKEQAPDCRVYANVSKLLAREQQLPSQLHECRAGSNAAGRVDERPSSVTAGCIAVAAGPDCTGQLPVDISLSDECSKNSLQANCLPQIFSGVTAYINGYTGTCSSSSSSHAPVNLSALHLQQIMRLHGACVTPLLRKRAVTHVIASSLCWSKTVKMSSSLKGPVFVGPQWVLDSVAAGRRLKESNYMIKQLTPQLNWGVQK